MSSFVWSRPFKCLVSRQRRKKTEMEKKHTQKLGKTTNYNFHQWNEDNKNVHPFLFWFLLHCEDCSGTRPHAIRPVSPSHRIKSLAALLKRLITSEIVTVDKFHQVNPPKKVLLLKKEENFVVSCIQLKVSVCISSYTVPTQSLETRRVFFPVLTRRLTG